MPILTTMQIKSSWIVSRVLCLALTCTAPTAHADTFTWLGEGFSFNWADNTGNWDPSTAQSPYPGYSPFFLDDVILPAASQAYRIDQDGLIEIGSIAVAAPYQLNVNGSLIIKQNVSGSGLTMTVGGALYFFDTSNAGNTTINVNNSSNGLTFFSASSAGTSTINSQGLIRFRDQASATNAKITLEGGNLDISEMAIPLTLNALHDTLAAPGTLTLGGASLTLTSAPNQVFHGTVSGTGILAQAGSGTLTLSGSGAGFSGDLLVQAGTLQLDGAFNSADVTVDGGAALRGSGSTGALSLVNGTLAPGSGTDASLNIASLACSDAQITFDLDAGTRLVINQALTVAQCPHWQVTLTATQPITSGQTFSIATLNAGTNYSLANLSVTPSDGHIASVSSLGSEIEITILDIPDGVFGNGFE